MVFGTEPRVLDGRYELGEEIGYGGMAEVFRGRDIRLGRDVALKMLRPDLARDPSFQARFGREAQAAASLNHPMIVAVYDTGEDRTSGVSLPYIVMEYVEGKTLRDVVQTEGRLLPRRALEIVADVCLALDYSHRAGIIHRDIKPGNVMLTRDGTVKVMDFGIARAVTASSATMTQTAAVIGTAQYLSPEQARGETVDTRSDVYSTGVVLYELLTGVAPFRGDSPVAVAYQHVREDARPPSSHDADLSPDLDAIVLKAMAKNPANRYQSAGEMRADLERAAAGQPVLATPVLRDEPTALLAPPPSDSTAYRREEPEPRRRRGLFWALLALAALALFAGAALLTHALVGGGKKGTAATVQVPNVAGQTPAAATARITGVGLRVTGSTKGHSSAQPAGLVFETNPGIGTSQQKSAGVALIVSDGPGQVTVPAVTNTDLPTAEQRLKQAGLRYTVTMFTGTSTEPFNTVVGAVPPDGKLIDSGSVVTLKVTSRTAAVPSLQGLNLQQAQTTLTAAGFSLGANTPTAAPGSATGTVVDSTPQSGKQAPRGSTVDVTVAAAPAPSQSPSPSPTTQAPTTAAATTSPPPPATSNPPPPATSRPAPVTSSPAPVLTSAAPVSPSVPPTTAAAAPPITISPTP